LRSSINTVLWSVDSKKGKGCVCCTDVKDVILCMDSLKIAAEFSAYFLY